MSPKYDAFGRPVAPSAPRPAPRGTPGDRTHGDAGGRSYGAPSAPRAPASSEDAGAATPEVRGLPPLGGGSPAGRPSRRRTKAWLNAAGGFGVAAFVVLAIIGSLVGDDDASTSGSGDRDDVTRTAPLTAGRAGSAMVALRAAMGPGDRVVSVSISDAYASARVTTVGRAGSRSLSVGSDGEVTASAVPSSPSSPGVPVADFDAGAPGEVVRAVARGLGPGSSGVLRSLSAYSYRDEPLRWTASVDGGPEEASSWSADEHGRAVVRSRDGAPAPPVGEPGPARVPTGIAGRSLLAPENLGQALGSLGSLPSLQDKTPQEIAVSSLNVEPERLLVGLQDGETRRLVSVDAALGLDPSSVSRSTTGETLPLSAVDATGPARALRTIGRRLNRDAASRVQSVSLATSSSAAGEAAGWFVLLEGEGDDRVWRATLDGRRVGRPGEDLTR